MNDQEKRDFDGLTKESRRFSELDEIKRQDHDLWVTNQSLYQEIQKLRISVIQTERDAEGAYTCMLSKAAP